MIKNMKIGTKILSLVTIILLLMVISAWFGIYQTGKIEAEITEIATQDFPLNETVTDLIILQLQQKVYFERAIRFGELRPRTAAQENQFRQAINDFQAITRLVDEQIRKGLDLTEQSVKKDETGRAGLESEKVREALKEIRKDYRSFNRSVETIFDLLQKSDVQSANTVVASVQQNSINQYERLKNILLKIKQFAHISTLKAQETEETASIASITLSIFCVIVGLFLAILIIRSINSPLKKAVGMAEKVAEGDLDIAIPANNRNDEIGLLMKSFARMVESLKEMEGLARRIAGGDLSVSIKPRSDRDALGMALKSMVENLRTQIQSMVESVNVLATSTNEISATISQISSAASETAAAVTETATTVQQVKQTAQLSSQKSKYVTESAQKAVQVSQTGAKSVNDTITGMNRIREQMESIAESIVQLSEQSQAIGAIISSVNDLAEQSNLLAVNASIEAAKAGEQGKGFAVVAMEVKSLAEQSKQATAQVRTILNDIQKATGSAVMATEQGTKAVEIGVKQSSETDTSIKHLGSSITEAAQAVNQIATSSNEQLIGMDQVTLAMENVKQASIQNVDSMKQLETAAHNLREVGESLKAMSKLYKL